jgi:hypothetical protein
VEPVSGREVEEGAEEIPCVMADRLLNLGTGRGKEQ